MEGLIPSGFAATLRLKMLTHRHVSNRCGDFEANGYGANGFESNLNPLAPVSVSESEEISHELDGFSSVSVLTVP